MSAIRERRLSFADVGFAVALLQHADSRGFVSASVSEIVEQTGAARRGVVDTLRRLHAAGVVVYKPTDTRYLKSSVQFIGAETATMKPEHHGKNRHDDRPEQECFDAEFASDQTGDDKGLKGLDLKPKPKTREYPIDSEPYKIASLLLQGIRKVDKFCKADLQKWADHVRLIHERDGRPYSDIEAVVRWLNTGADPDAKWWRGVILSTKNLRAKFPQLYVKAQPWLKHVTRHTKRDATDECPTCHGIGFIEENDVAEPCSNPECKSGRVPRKEDER